MAEALEGSARAALLAQQAWDAADPYAAEPPSPRGFGGPALSNLGAASAMSTAAPALEFTPAAAQSCLEEVFGAAAQAMAAAASDFLQSGSTAVCCMLLQDRCGAARVGSGGGLGMGVARSTGAAAYRGKQELPCAACQPRRTVHGTMLLELSHPCDPRAAAAWWRRGRATRALCWAWRRRAGIPRWSSPRCAGRGAVSARCAGVLRAGLNSQAGHLGPALAGLR